jgi:hypothetical protein
MFRKASHLLHRSLVGFLMATIFLFLTNHTRAAGVLCHVSDPHDPALNVRDSPGGTVVNRLQNERIVQLDESKTDATGQIWAQVSGKFHGDDRVWGWVLRDSLGCVDTDKFPVVEVSVATLAEAGILSQQAHKVAKRVNSFVSCGEDLQGWGVDVSHELYDAYMRRGFSKKALCFALGGWGVYFDPATGRRLKLYNWPKAMGGPRPLWIPDCYKEIRMVGTESGGEFPWRPAGCTLRYHPTTGRPITKSELVELSSGGPAGGAVDEDNQSSAISEDRLQSLINGK